MPEQYAKTLKDRWLERPSIGNIATALDYAQSIPGLVEDSVVVKWCSSGQSLLDLTLKHMKFPLVTPPFPSTMLEFQKNAVLVVQGEQFDQLDMFVMISFPGSDNPTFVCRATVFLDLDGDVELDGNSAKGTVDWFYDTTRPGFETFKAEISQRVHMALMVLSMMNCRNTERIEHRPPEKLSRKHQQRHGRPLVNYYTLEISLTKKLLREQGGMSESGEGLERALHICRGHFKDYRSEESKGLFGKHKGLFWWQPAVRGDAGAGVNVKDYKLKL